MAECNFASGRDKGLPKTCISTVLVTLPIASGEGKNCGFPYSIYSYFCHASNMRVSFVFSVAFGSPWS
jgi:hypothetical protein